jgi:hypothetical protein
VLDFAHRVYLEEIFWQQIVAKPHAGRMEIVIDNSADRDLCSVSTY